MHRKAFPSLLRNPHGSLTRLLWFPKRKEQVQSHHGTCQRPQLIGMCPLALEPGWNALLPLMGVVCGHGEEKLQLSTVPPPRPGDPPPPLTLPPLEWQALQALPCRPAGSLCRCHSTQVLLCSSCACRRVPVSSSRDRNGRSGAELFFNRILIT